MKTKEGYTTFMTVLVIMGLILLFMGLGSLSSISFGKLGLTVAKGIKLRSGADSCLEEALLRIRNDWHYSHESFSLDGVNCQIAVSGNGIEKTIDFEVVSDLGTIGGTALVKRRGFSVNLVKMSLNE